MIGRSLALALVFAAVTLIQKVDWEWRWSPVGTPPPQPTIIVLPPAIPPKAYLRKRVEPHTSEFGLWATFLDGRVEGPFLFTATAYNEHDGHTPGTITASGLPVMEEITAACGPELDLGDVVVLENGMILRCLDRGGSIGVGDIDIYLSDVDEARDFGIQMIRGVVLR